MLPLMTPGCAGAAAVIETIKVLVVPLPQELFAFTDIVPPVVPDVVLIELVVEVPVQPDGNVQV